MLGIGLVVLPLASLVGLFVLALVVIRRIKDPDYLRIGAGRRFHLEVRARGGPHLPRDTGNETTHS
jgi:hypothetical protein